ncbi:alpha/beta fold hydrolase [Pseudovibrio exalbescens]|uniref:PHA/PHB synthase family protein n=1 Tax=Pseudovibrio exalbescens TaxID=197461 RepID=UPI0023670E75|nr:alpha/beta fold hydrolase [Pseudovibrio exalbescens]MDD7911459.1 alpha/beta fold hydrolase [Pseudovibrio exalbescens]
MRNFSKSSAQFEHADGRSAAASGARGKPVAKIQAPADMEGAADVIDKAFKSSIAHMTKGLSPAGMATKGFSWAAHLALSPGKQMLLAQKALKNNMLLWSHLGDAAMGAKAEPFAKPQNGDRRFSSEDWQKWPYNYLYQAFLLNQEWWQEATTNVDGLSSKDEREVSFVARQLLDMFAPSNGIATNPEVLKTALKEGGMNFVRGAENFAEDFEQYASGKRPESLDQFKPGEAVAATEGKVVFRNHLIELIQYSPATETVYPEPIFIVPAWIMKYYILDLSPENSLVRYLVEQGHTVFMVSWRNPTAEDRELGMDDYRQQGVMDALDAISTIVPDQKIHGVGYCLGGTMLSIAAAAMARDGDDRFASLTTLAAQVDFTEAGELMLFIRDSEIAFLSNMMWEQGYLDGMQMAGAFQILRSNDLVWSRLVHDYLIGERTGVNDLMAWNADLTRMPYRMHKEYLTKLFLHNDLASGRYMVGDRPIHIADIRAPIFAVGTVKDHVAPWRSAYKITAHPATDVTFLLTSGGHNAGIVSEPGHPRRHYQVQTIKSGDPYVDPDTWQAQAPTKEGSWWPEWHAWLAERSGEKGKPPTMGAPRKGYKVLCDAPGEYIHQL